MYLCKIRNLIHKHKQCYSLSSRFRSISSIKFQSLRQIVLHFVRTLLSLNLYQYSLPVSVWYLCTAIQIFDPGFWVTNITIWQVEIITVRKYFLFGATFDPNGIPKSAILYLNNWAQQLIDSNQITHSHVSWKRKIFLKHNGLKRKTKEIFNNYPTFVSSSTFQIPTQGAV